ncbi:MULTISPECIES: SDR family NAD(P)-dependent oxidoreductase [unclassified Nocardioides]|uniref:SDR family NAD(P)-dependent oxidoreductase n=1 Tax=unclassified Nocardioides TaxID=2615069 RepID=UPI00360A368D
MSVALVTGATSGIGRAFADELHRRGWDLVLVARDGERLAQVAAELGGAEVLVADLATPAGCASVVARLGSLDLLVNAAGCGTRHRFPDEDLAAERTMLDLNVTATLLLSHAAARAQVGVVNVASTAAVWSTGTYAASKAWVLAATRGLADAVRPAGVRVTAVVPGFTRTEFHARSGTDAGGVRPWLWLTAEQVAREGLDAWEAGRTVCVPGRAYRVLVPLARALGDRPRARLLRALGPLRPAQDGGSSRGSNSRSAVSDS